MSEANKELVRRHFEEIFNRKNLEVCDEMMAEDYVEHAGTRAPYHAPNTSRFVPQPGRASGRFHASGQGTQNLVDSYTYMVPKVLEVLPSETRHRGYRIRNLSVTIRAEVTLLVNVVLIEGQESRTRGLASSYRHMPCHRLATRSQST